MSPKTLMVLGRPSQSSHSRAGRAREEKGLLADSRASRRKANEAGCDGNSHAASVRDLRRFDSGQKQSLRVVNDYAMPA